MQKLEVLGAFRNMHTVTRKIIEQGLKGRILRVNQLSRILGGSDARRYGLINRAQLKVVSCYDCSVVYMSCLITIVLTEITLSLWPKHYDSYL